MELPRLRRAEWAAFTPDRHDFVETSA